MLNTVMLSQTDIYPRISGKHAIERALGVFRTLAAHQSKICKYLKRHALLLTCAYTILNQHLGQLYDSLRSQSDQIIDTSAVRYLHTDYPMLY